MEHDFNYFAHRGWGGHHHHGFGRRMWRGYGYGYPFFRPWYWRRRGGCCGPLLFLGLLTLIVPIGLVVLPHLFS